MKFSEAEIELARKLRKVGLPWEPAAGHYVFDETGFCKQPSPFQEGVYFILNYEYFMKAVGGVDRFGEIMTWLPTWYDCRQILQHYDVTAEAIAADLRSSGAVESGRERLRLYELIARTLGA